MQVIWVHNIKLTSVRECRLSVGSLLASQIVGCSKL